MVLFVGSENIGKGGKTRIWNLDMPKGYYSDEKFEDMKKSAQVIFEHKLSKPFETLFIRDRFIKHEVRYFSAKNPTQKCVRNVIVNFLRKPLLNGADNESYIEG